MKRLLAPWLRGLACAWLASTAAAQSQLAVSGVPEGAPFALRCSATPAELVLELELEPEWHMYGRDVGGGKPVELRIEDGSAFAADGALAVPMDAHGKITGKARLVLPLRRTGEGRALRARFGGQVCDALECLPPLAIALQGDVAEPKVRVLLATKEIGERSDRIAAFLRERGLQCTPVPYQDVKLEACDAHDVVVADSPLFDQAGGVRKHVQAFPKTAAPIVAVGFLGTQLLEAHKIAMACGYI